MITRLPRKWFTYPHQSSSSSSCFAAGRDWQSMVYFMVAGFAFGAAFLGGILTHRSNKSTSTEKSWLYLWCWIELIWIFEGPMACPTPFCPCPTCTWWDTTHCVYTLHKSETSRKNILSRRPSEIWNAKFFRATVLWSSTPKRRVRLLLSSPKSPSAGFVYSPQQVGERNHRSGGRDLQNCLANEHCSYTKSVAQLRNAWL